MMAFLGMTGFSSHWIEENAKVAPLMDLIEATEAQVPKVFSAPLVWTTEELQYTHVEEEKNNQLLTIVLALIL